MSNEIVFTEGELSYEDYDQIELLFDDWSQIECSFDQGAIITKEDAVKAAKITLDNCKKNNMLNSYVLTSIFHDTKNNIWIMGYAEDRDENAMWKEGTVGIAINGDNCEILKMWITE